MKSQQFLAASLLLLAVAGIGSARAESALYDSAVVVDGQQGFVQSLDITTSGTLTFSISNIPWLDVVSGLTSFLSTPTGVVGTTLDGAGSESIQVGPGIYYAHWFGDAQGTFNEGVLGVNIEFQPNGTTAVPAPASVLLMLSGLGVLLGWSRRRASIPA
jgi:hypothetical protein